MRTLCDSVYPPTKVALFQPPPAEKPPPGRAGGSRSPTGTMLRRNKGADDLVRCSMPIGPAHGTARTVPAPGGFRYAKLATRARAVGNHGKSAMSYSHAASAHRGRTVTRRLIWQPN
jgi:hypothetical protein